VICPSCGYENVPGQDECIRCESSLMQEDVPQPDTPTRWRVMVDPISSLDPSTIEPQIVPAGTSLAEGVRRMQEKNVGYLLVTGTDGRLAGILTEHDLLCRVAGQVTSLESYTVDELMSPRPTALKSSEPIKHALHFMALNDFMYIPLVDSAERPEDLLSFRRVARLIEHME
jgi:predicted transcriptional regulator